MEFRVWLIKNNTNPDGTPTREQVVYESVRDMQNGISEKFGLLDRARMREDGERLASIYEASAAEKEALLNKYLLIKEVMIDMITIKNVEELNMFIAGIQYFKNQLFNA